MVIVEGDKLYCVFDYTPDYFEQYEVFKDGERKK
jgi:hypothetical protein